MTLCLNRPNTHTGLVISFPTIIVIVTLVYDTSLDGVRLLSPYLHATSAALSVIMLATFCVSPKWRTQHPKVTLSLVVLLNLLFHTLHLACPSDPLKATHIHLLSITQLESCAARLSYLVHSQPHIASAQLLVLHDSHRCAATRASRTIASLRCKW